jgi:hypothetical protein
LPSKLQALSSNSSTAKKDTVNWFRQVGAGVTQLDLHVRGFDLQVPVNRLSLLMSQSVLNGKLTVLY